MIKKQFPGMYVIIDLPMTTTSLQHEWFTSSENEDGGYASYYHWQRGGGSSVKVSTSL